MLGAADPQPVQSLFVEIEVHCMGYVVASVARRNDVVNGP